MANLAHKKRIITAFIAFVLAATSFLCVAASGEALSKEELLELEDVRTAASFLPFEKENPDTLKQQLLAKGYKLASDDINQFGVRRMEFKKDHKHLKTALSVDVFNQTIGAYGVDFSLYGFDETLSHTLSAEIDKIWQENGGINLNHGEINVLTEASERDELEDIYALTRLLPFEKQDPVNLKQQLIQLGYKVFLDKTDHFGFTRITLRKETNYKKSSLAFQVFNNELAYYALVVDIPGRPSYVNSHNEPLNKLFRDVWQQNGGVGLWDEPSLSAAKSFDDVYADYLRAVTSGKDKLRPVSISTGLSDYVALVSDAGYSSDDDDCLHTCEGESFSRNASDTKISMENLLEANRIDLVENILNGFNPIARIYAIRVLEASGLASNPTIKKQINKILGMNTRFNVCEKSRQTAREFKSSLGNWNPVNSNQDD